MNPWLKRSIIITAAVAVFVITVRLAWPLLPVTLRAKIIRGEYSISQNRYLTYNRLGDMLGLGMSPAEVQMILGPPTRKDSLESGVRWEYDESGPTSGGGCVVDFMKDGDRLTLHWFLNFQHLAFRDSSHREFGSPVDGGRFEGDPAIKLRWNEWHSVAGKQAN